MHTQEKCAEHELQRSSADLHVIFGSGGTKAILGGTGALLALELAGLKDFRSIGCASGGSIPASLLAAGVPVDKALRVIVDTDFQGLLHPRVGFLGRLLALLRKPHYESVRPARGAYGTQKMAAFVNALVPKWPDALWTVASCDHGQVLFSKDGVSKWGPLHQGHLLSDKPADVGLAVCATCAIPGILDAAEFQGEHLFDGALSGDGVCPVDVAIRHFGASRHNCIAVDVGEEPITKARWLRLLWNIFCGGKCVVVDTPHPTEEGGLILVKPEITGFHGLKFELSRDLKWRAMLTGFHACAKKLLESGLVTSENECRLRHFMDHIDNLMEACFRPGELSRRIEAFLGACGLFAMETPPTTGGNP